MPLAEFQNLVLHLANGAFVRYSLWLNYPNDPPLMGLDFGGNNVAINTTLQNELTARGFAFHEGLRMWTVERTDLEL